MNLIPFWRSHVVLFGGSWVLNMPWSDHWTTKLWQTHIFFCAKRCCLGIDVQYTHSAFPNIRLLRLEAKNKQAKWAAPGSGSKLWNLDGTLYGSLLMTNVFGVLLCNPSVTARQSKKKNQQKNQVKHTSKEKKIRWQKTEKHPWSCSQTLYLGYISAIYQCCTGKSITLQWNFTPVSCSPLWSAIS